MNPLHRLKNIKFKYTMLNFWGTLIVIVISLALLYFAIPKTDLDIFFDPTYSNSTFVISNLGNKPVTDVKVSYEMDCQRIEYTPKYINLPVPSLTESGGINPNYIYNFDNHTQEIINNYLSHYSECQDLQDAYYFFSFESIQTKIDNGIFGSTFTSWMCDPCKLKINVISKQKSVKREYTMYNPMELTFNVSCVPNVKGNGISHHPLDTYYECKVIMYNSNNMTLYPNNQKVFSMRYLDKGIEYRFKKI